MERKQLAILAIIIFILIVTLACESTSTSSGPSSADSQAAYPTTTATRQLSSLELAAQETAIALETKEALANEARGTADALANQKQATVQVRDAQRTAEAQALQATREAWEFEETATAAARQATASAEAAHATSTRQAEDATSTATREQATATAEAISQSVRSTQQAVALGVEQTRAAATAQAIDRDTQSAQSTHLLRTYAPWAVLLLALIALAFFTPRLINMLIDRWRVIRFAADEGEPIVMITRERMAFPRRGFNSYLDLTPGQERSPLLAPSVEAQEAATMRQQTANAIQARQTAATVRARKAHKRPYVVNGKARQIKQGKIRPRRRRTPGLIKVVPIKGLSEATQEGILSPQLAQAIEGQWKVVED